MDSKMHNQKHTKTMCIELVPVTLFDALLTYHLGKAPEDSTGEGVGECYVSWRV